MVKMFEDDEECGEDEHRKKAVEQRGTAHGDGNAVEGNDQTGESRREFRVEQLCRDGDGQGDDRDASQGNRKAPTERVVRTEQRHACTDEPLAQWRVRNEHGTVEEVGSVTGREVRRRFPLGFVTQVPHRPRVANVIDFVEDQRLRAAQIDESNQGRDDEHRQEQRE